MEIKDLKAGEGKIDVIGEVIEIAEPRNFDKFGKTGKVANAILKDDSGQIKLTLWNEQVDQVKEGDKIHITNGYVSEWKDEKQLSTGKFGKLEVVK
ncbi:MAG: OB-fold nucleic acid binding domain-containing protein [Nanoarchaeota archaeon]